MNKIIILGCPGSGKSTLARKISNRLDIPILYLDKIFWVDKGGIKQDKFLELQKDFVNSNDRWIIDGDFLNSTSFSYRIDEASDVLIYNLPKYITVYRFLKRSFKTFGKSREDMPETRKENLKSIWGTLKYIISYDNSQAFTKIDGLGYTEKVKSINSTKDEDLGNLL